MGSVPFRCTALRFWFLFFSFFFSKIRLKTCVSMLCIGYSAMDNDLLSEPEQQPNKQQSLTEMSSVHRLGRSNIYNERHKENIEQVNTTTTMKRVRSRRLQHLPPKMNACRTSSSSDRPAVVWVAGVVDLVVLTSLAAAALKRLLDPRRVGRRR